MDRLELSRILNRWNPWWIGKEPVLPEFKRSEFFVLKKELSNRKVTVVTGPRQTGKTTLMHQLALALIKEEKVRPQRILYLLLDDVIDELKNGNLTIREILQVWSEDVLGESLTDAQKYVFFDEVQMYKKWSREIKSLEQQKYPIKFFISGSSSVDILKDTAESLAGRILRIIIMPLKFNEIPRFYLGNSEISAKINAAGSALLTSLYEAIRDNRPERFFASAQNLQKVILPVESRMRILLNNYVQKGGYPEIALTELDQFQCFARLKNYIDSIIHKDFVNFFNVRDTKTLERILKVVSKNTSQIISERNLAKDLGASINTIRNHLGFLETTFLVMSSGIFSKSIAKRTRRPQKLYINDIGLGNALVGYDDNDKGKITETLVHNHLQFLSIDNPLYRFDISYWKQDYEVDIVLSSGKRCLPIEVKHSKSDVTKGIKFLADKHKTWGLVVSGELKSEGKIIFIPLQLLLLMA